MERKEHKIGERFKDGNTLFETVKGDCPECFYSGNGCDNDDIHGPCCSQDRTDETDVFFKEMKNMKEENSNKDEHFYIWGVPNRGEEVKKLLESKGCVAKYSNRSFEDSTCIFFIEDKEVAFISKVDLFSLCNLITSNWTELKLPWKPKDKELVWAWDNNFECKRILGFYDIKNFSLFGIDGKRDLFRRDNYASFEGEYPQWAKDALSKLEE
jgi:hypothetical protein